MVLDDIRNAIGRVADWEERTRSSRWHFYDNTIFFGALPGGADPVGSGLFSGPKSGNSGSGNRNGTGQPNLRRFLLPAGVAIAGLVVINEVAG